MNKKLFNSNLFNAFLCFIISFIFYLKTLMPGMGGWGDSARFQFFGKILGTSYPTGYPLYILINNIFSHLPFGSLAYRINLMSAFFASATLFLLFLIINKLIRNRTLSLLSTLIFGFSRLFWQQSLIAEVYTLNSFLLALLILILMEWAEGKQLKYLYLASFIYGLSLGNHLAMVLILPALLYFAAATDHKMLFSKKNLPVIIFLFLLGVLQYIYVFIRSQAFDSYIELRVYNVSKFIQALSGGRFKNNMFSFTPIQLFYEKLPIYIMSLISQFNPIGYITGLVGMCVLFRDRIKYGIFFLLIIVANLFYSLEYDIFDIDVYFIPTFMLFAIFIGFGLNRKKFINKGKTRIKGLHPWFSVVRDKSTHYASIGIAAILLISVLTFNYSVVDQSKSICMNLFADNMLDTVENNSLIIAPNYNWSQYYLYKLIGEKRRKDDNIFITGDLGRPLDYITPPYFSFTFKENRLAISPTKIPDANEELFTIFPDTPDSGELRNLNIYLHTRNKEKLDREGISSKKILSLSCLGFEQKLYKIINKPSVRKIKERALNLTPATGKGVFKNLYFRIFGSFKISFRFKDRKYLKYGWDRVEYTKKGIPYCWAVGKTSSIIVPLKKPEKYNMTLRIRPPAFKRSIHQTLKIHVNGNYSTELKLEDGWNEYSLTLPDNYFVCGDNLISFEYKHTTTKYNTTDKPDLRKLAVAFEWIKFRKKGSGLN